MENLADYIINDDCLAALKNLPSESVNCCVTSPPYYGLRDYGIDGQIGREKTPERYVKRLTEVFSQLRRVLRKDGTLWLNIADSYCGSGSKGVHTDPKYPKGRNGQQTSITYNVKNCKHKDLIGIPWLLAFALRSDGWYLRSDIIWQKGNCSVLLPTAKAGCARPTSFGYQMPENVKYRPTRSYEHVFLFSKSRRYYYDSFSIAEPAITKNKSIDDINFPPFRNCRDVWNINTIPYKGDFFAAYPVELAERCILAGCPEDGVVIDPFFGSGTTGLAAVQNNRSFIGIEINPKSCLLAAERISKISHY